MPHNTIVNMDQALQDHKLSQLDYAHIKEILKREPTLVELGVFSAMCLSIVRTSRAKFTSTASRLKPHGSSKDRVKMPA